MMYDVIIIGAGPAGLFASLYLARNSKLKVLLIDEGKLEYTNQNSIHARNQKYKTKNMGEKDL